MSKSTTRAFKAWEERAMGRKASLADAPFLALQRDRLNELVVGGIQIIEFDGTHADLARACRDFHEAFEAAEIHFLALNTSTGGLVAVNTEGHDYPRYLAHLAVRAIAEDVGRQATA